MKTKEMQKLLLSKKEAKKDQIIVEDANWVRSVEKSNRALPCLDNNRLAARDVSGNARKKRRLSKKGLKGRVKIDGRWNVRRRTVSAKEVLRTLKNKRILDVH